jgi:redox-sensing transcriptional repressor
MIRQKISAAPSVRRLPSYLHTVKQIGREGREYISGTLIARELGLEPIQVRKDLAITGITGKPKKGYPAGELAEAIERFLGWDSPRDAVLVGAGNLGTALMGYTEFQFRGLRIRAAFDRDPRKTGKLIHGVPVKPIDIMENEIRSLGAEIAILTVPGAEAQATADILVKAGVEGIWNFTNIKLKTPDQVVVREEDLSSGYAMLCVMLQAKVPNRGNEDESR